MHLADSLAKSGYRAFRFDLPGLGDSDGDLSAQDIDFDAMVEEGAFGPVLSDMANQLAERFHLRGLVIVGHCAGAVTALYAAAANQRVLGLILLDPYFHLPQTTETQNVLVRSQLRFVNKLLPEQPGQSVVRDGAVKVLSHIRKVYDRLAPIRGLVRRKQLPANANLPLVRCWKQVVSAGLPVLVLRSPFANPKLGEFDYIRDLHPLSGANCRVSIQIIDGATHAFAERPVREAVQNCTKRWLTGCFPARGAETPGAEQGFPELTSAIPAIQPEIR